MSIRLKVFLILILLTFIFYIIYRIKTKKLTLKYSLLWLFASLFMIISVFSEKILAKLAAFIGIETVSNMIFLFGLGILMILTFALTNIISKQKKTITSLVQELAILKKEVRGNKND